MRLQVRVLRRVIIIYLYIYMVNYLKSITRKYDREIVKKCNDCKSLVDECLYNNFNDTFVCSPIIKNFKKCVTDFDKQFREKYNINKNVQTFNLP